jgi:hypothetical protein
MHRPREPGCHRALELEAPTPIPLDHEQVKFRTGKIDQVAIKFQGKFTVYVAMFLHWGLLILRFVTVS